MAITTEFAPDRDVAYEAAADAALVKKIALRLIPFLFFLYVIAYLDRVNVGFAKLQMSQQLGFSEAVYGTASGIFFIGYFLFEIPSNLLLQRFGARRWIMRIMISWGLVAMAMLFVNSTPVFYVMRFLLGLAEAGFFPGILLYLTFWFTAKERAKVVAWFMTANAVSFIFGGPLSGFLMTHKFIPGLMGWQQMFLLEGIPAILMGIVVLFYLPNGPQNAKWLTDEEKARVQSRVTTDAGKQLDRGGHYSKNLLPLFSIPAVWILCACFFCFVAGMYGFSLWIPQIVKQMGTQDAFQTGLLTAIPFLISGTLMVINGYHSDHTGERGLHICIPGLIGAGGLIFYALFADAPMPAPVPALIALSVAASGMWAMLGPFWAMAPRVLRSGGPVAVAGGLALINSVGNLGGFLGPFAVGVVKDATKSFAGGVFVLAGLVILGSILSLVAGKMTAKDA